MANILVLAEQRGGVLNPQSIEVVVAGQQLAAALGADLDIGLIGGDIEAAAAELANVSAGRLFLISDAALEPYRAETQDRAARALVGELTPQYVLSPHTYLVRDFVPRLAASFKRMLINDCIGFRHENGQTVFQRQLFGGKVNADVVATGDQPHFISFQAGAFRADELKTVEGGAATQTMDAGLDAGQIRSRADDPVHELADGVDLTNADIIVSVGRGIQDEKNIALAEQLAKSLDAEVGASRPVCDAGWISADHQVGSSGQTVAPKLYLALGISGSIQHMVGAKGSKTIAAINTDPKAPIFKSADYGIVGDVLEVVPELIKALD